MVVNPNLAVSVNVSVSQNPVCAGTSVIFTATPVNGGTAPTYQWKLNDVTVGTNNPVYTYVPTNGDLVWCILISSEVCTSNNPAFSIQHQMIVNDNLPVSVSILSSANPVCAGTLVTFTATPVNGGTIPVYQWKVNGVNAGTDNPTYSYIPANSDLVSCVLTSNASCTSGNPATSNIITVQVLLKPVLFFALCIPVTTRDAQPFTLKEGLPLGGSFSGTAIQGNKFNPALVPAGETTSSVTYSYTNVNHCTSSASQAVTVFPANTGFICGQPLTDVRDNQIYPTVKIGSQCWMASNLDYGMTVLSSAYQTDNCLAEKFCYSDLASNCTTYGGLYQWDELMQYEATQGVQGFCPPGWHVPAENEWNILFSYYQSNAFAGKSLQDPFINGFNAFRSGVLYLKTSWSFMGFATIFWSSNAWGPLMALSHGMNSINFSVSLYPASRANAFPVRCLKD